MNRILIVFSFPFVGLTLSCSIHETLDVQPIVWRAARTGSLVLHKTAFQFGVSDGLLPVRFA